MSQLNISDIVLRHFAPMFGRGVASADRRSEIESERQRRAQQRSIDVQALLGSNPEAAATLPDLTGVSPNVASMLVGQANQRLAEESQGDQDRLDAEVIQRFTEGFDVFETPLIDQVSPVARRELTEMRLAQQQNEQAVSEAARERARWLDGLVSQLPKPMTSVPMYLLDAPEQAVIDWARTTRAEQLNDLGFEQKAQQLQRELSVLDGKYEAHMEYVGAVPGTPVHDEIVAQREIERANLMSSLDAALDGHSTMQVAGRLSVQDAIRHIQTQSRGTGAMDGQSAADRFKFIRTHYDDQIKRLYSMWRTTNGGITLSPDGGFNLMQLGGDNPEVTFVGGPVPLTGEVLGPGDQDRAVEILRRLEGEKQAEFNALVGDIAGASPAVTQDAPAVPTSALRAREERHRREIDQMSGVDDLFESFDSAAESIFEELER